MPTKSRMAAITVCLGWLAVMTGALRGAGYADEDMVLFKLAPKARHTPAAAIPQVVRPPEVAISAGLRGEKGGELLLFVHTAAKGLETVPEANVFKEYAGTALNEAWEPREAEKRDKEHVALFSEQLRLMARTRFTLADIVTKAEKEQDGKVLHVRPGTLGERPLFFVQLMTGDKKIRMVHYDLIAGD